jgi:hypothetical protein
MENTKSRLNESVFDWKLSHKPAASRASARASHANGARRRSGARESVWGSPRGEAPRVRLAFGAQDFEERHRVDARSIEANAPVQVRSGGPAGGADLSHDIARLYGVLHTHGDLRQVGEDRNQPEPVVQCDRPAGEEEIVGQYDDGRCRRSDRSTRWCAEVDAGMRAARLSVEDAARAESVLRRGGDRRFEPSGKRLPRRGPEERIEPCGVGSDAFDFGGWRLHVDWSDSKAARGKPPGGDGQQMCRGQRPRVGRLSCDLNWIRSRGSFEIHTNQT